MSPKQMFHERRRNTMGSVLRRCVGQRLLLMISIMLVSTTTEAEMFENGMTFSECKIFLLASDTARDMSLNEDPEYVRFLNLVARTYRVPAIFETFDALPLPLMATYKAYSLTDDFTIDISAAMFGAQTSEYQLSTLEAFCNQTSSQVENVINELKEENEEEQEEESASPTWSPTYLEGLESSTTQPSAPSQPAATPKPSDLSQPSAPLEPSQPTAPLSFDLQSNQNVLMGESGSVTALPIECRRGIFGADADKNGYLTPLEYKTFVNRITSNAYAHAGTFDALPKELKDNFDRLADEDQINVFGAIPTQWAEASPVQRQFLQLVCYRTEDALVAAHEAALQPQNQTTAPSTNAPVVTIVPASSVQPQQQNETVSPSSGSPITNTTSYDNDGNGGRKKLDKNIIVAIVGSILITIMGIYLAIDKSECLKRACSSLWLRIRKGTSKWKQRRAAKRAVGVDNILKCEISITNRVDPTVGMCDDLESLQTERTGFLEDTRVGPLPLRSVMEEDLHETTSVSEPPRNFETVRFNPDDVIEAQSPPKMEEYDSSRHNAAFTSPGAAEESENLMDDFGDYGYDSLEDEDSDNMSLYCGPPAGGGKAESAPPKKKEKKKKKDAELPLSPFRRSDVLYHSKRFSMQIVDPEIKKDSIRSSSRISGRSVEGRRRSNSTRNSRSPSTSRSSCTRDSLRIKTARKSKRTSPQKKARSQRRPQKRRVAPNQDNASSSPSEEKGITRKSHPPPSSRTATPPREPDKQVQPVAREPGKPAQPVDRILRYAMDESDDSDTTSSDSFSSISFPKQSELEKNSPSNSLGEGLFESADVFSDDDSLDDAHFAWEKGTSTNVPLNDERDKGKPMNAPPNNEKEKNGAMGGQEESDEESDSSSFLSEEFPDPATDEDCAKAPLPNKTGGFGLRAMLSLFQGKESEILVDTLAQSKPNSDKQPTSTEKAPPASTIASNVPSNSLANDEQEPTVESTSGSESGSSSRTSDNSLLKDDSEIIQVDNEELARGDSDSTYEGSSDTSSLSFTIFGDSSESERQEENTKKPNALMVKEIQELVVKVMPTEQENLPRMLEQYKGREKDLLKTLHRLEVRMEARRASCTLASNPAMATTLTTAAATSTGISSANRADKIADKILRNRALLHRASAVSEKAGRLTAETTALIAGDGQNKGVNTCTKNDSCGSSEGGESSGRKILDLESSTEVDDDDFSDDSTYSGEEDARYEDESWSVFSESLLQ